MITYLCIEFAVKLGGRKDTPLKQLKIWTWVQTQALGPRSTVCRCDSHSPKFLTTCYFGFDLEDNTSMWGMVDNGFWKEVKCSKCGSQISPVWSDVVPLNFTASYVQTIVLVHCQHTVMSWLSTWVDVFLKVICGAENPEAFWLWGGWRARGKNSL